MGNASAMRLWNERKDKIKGQGARDEAGLCEYLLVIFLRKSIEQQ